MLDKATAPAVIGVDIGGTKINVGLISREGHVLIQQTMPAMAEERRVMEQAIEGIDSVMHEAKSGYAEYRIAGIGIGSAGQIDFSRGYVYYASSLIPGYTGTRIRDIVKNRYRLPVFVDNDVNVLALAEARFGAGKDAKHILCLALGTGVGGAIITDGKLLHGANGGAGEIGHMSVDFRGPRCICGNYGCLELYASGTGIARLYHEKLALSIVGENPNKGSLSAIEVAARWLQGETAATQVMEEAIAALGAAVASLIHSLNPQKVVIGGGVAEIGEPLFRRLIEVVDRRTMPSMRKAADIVPAVMGNRSGMVGAAMQVWEYGSGK
ncbi:MAG: hypothetical protein JWR03_2493 [Cohnella sp.]|nr:hypothetical protein [Cohnella sp.]